MRFDRDYQDSYIRKETLTDTKGAERITIPVWNMKAAGRMYLRQTHLRKTRFKHQSRQLRLTLRGIEEGR